MILPCIFTDMSLDGGRLAFLWLPRAEKDSYQRVAWWTYKNPKNVLMSFEVRDHFSGNLLCQLSFFGGHRFFFWQIWNPRWCVWSLFTPLRLKVVCVVGPGRVETNPNRGNKKFGVWWSIVKVFTQMIWEGKIWCKGFWFQIHSKKRSCRLASDLLRLFIRTFQGATRHAEEWRTCPCFVFLFTPSMNGYLWCYLFNCFVYALPGDFMFLLPFSTGCEYCNNQGCPFQSVYKNGH